MARRASREVFIGVAVSALAVGAMAIDHLVGTESEPGESGAAEPVAFFASSAVALALAGILFGFIVPRAHDDPDRAAAKAMSCSLLAVASVPLLFLAVPFPLAGAGIALGLLGREHERTRLATAAVALGALVIALGAGAYVVALVA